MNTLYALSLLVLMAYTLTSVAIFGVPKSLSDTHYLWNERWQQHSSLFTFAMMATVFPLLPVFIEYSTDNTQFLAFISAAALAFVGAACCFKQRLTRTVHFAAAGICAACAVLWTLFNMPNGVAIVAASGIIFGTTGILDRKSFVFWVEMGAFAIVYVSLFVKLVM